jgi:tetratricopeptide (TPR) repeat protein
LTFVEVSYGPLGLALLKAGKSPEDVIKAYTKAMEMYPNNAEMIFWPAVTLAASGNVEKSLPLFKKSVCNG